MFKKIIFGILITLSLCFLSVSVFASEPIPTTQKIKFEDKIVNITEPIVNIDWHIYVPIRTFCETIGYGVDWSKNGIVVYKSASEYSVIREGSYEYVNNKGYISLRALGELLKKEVEYDETTQTALVGCTKINIPITPAITTAEQPTEQDEMAQREYHLVKGVSPKTVTIDPGHGGKDPGAIGNGLNEKDLNIVIALRVRELLVNDGYTVYITRTDDTYVSLQDRYEYANNNDTEIFVSIHNNAATNTEARGTEVLCNFGTDSELLAKNIMTALAQNLETTNRGVKDGSRLTVIKGTYMPAVIVEGLFVSNAEDAEMLKDPMILEKIAFGIYQGIKNTI